MRLVSKLSLGVRVKIVNYGGTISSIEKITNSNYKFMYKDKDNLFVYDSRPYLLGIKGVVTDCQESSGYKYEITFDDETKLAWFKEEQLEKINNNNNNKNKFKRYEIFKRR